METNKHHLFSYHQIRKQIVLIFGEPKTDEEHIFIGKETKKVWKKMPTYEMDIEKHKKLHEMGENK